MNLIAGRDGDGFGRSVFLVIHILKIFLKSGRSGLYIDIGTQTELPHK